MLGLNDALQGSTPAQSQRPSRMTTDPHVAGQLPPEMQEALKKAYGLSVKALYDEKFSAKAAEMIRRSETPEAGIGRVAATLGARVYYAARDAGEEIPPEVLLVGGFDLVNEVAEFAEEMVGVEIGPETVEDAFYVASDNLKAALRGDGPQGGSPEEMEQMLAMAGGPEAVDGKLMRMKQAQMPQVAASQERGVA